MADNRKYYYLKLKENFFDSENMILLEGMDEGYLYSNILLKLYLKSLKDDGCLLLNGRIPYNAKMLSFITRHDEEIVDRAMSVFITLGLVEVLDNGAIYMSDIQSFIGESSTEADRKRAYRKRIDGEKKQIVQMSQECPNIVPTLSQECPLEIEKEIEKETKVNYQLVADMYNETCVSFPKVTKLSDQRKKAIKARLKNYSLEDFRKVFEMAEASRFLKGQNNRNWSANFDWLICDGNMAKVLDGNYSDSRPEKKIPDFEKPDYYKHLGEEPGPDDPFQ